MSKQEKFDAYPEGRRLETLEGERRRIESELSKHTDPREAKGVAHQLFSWAIELDKISDEIRYHPLINADSVDGEFDYDGKVFRHKKDKSEFYTCYDGLNFLKFWNGDNIPEWFLRKENDGGTNFLNYAEKKFVDVARDRLEYLIKKDKDNSIGEDTMEGEVKKRLSKDKKSNVPIPPRHIPSDFFEKYEKQMEEVSKQKEKILDKK